MYNALLWKIEAISCLYDVLEVLSTIILARLGDEIDREQCGELVETLLNEVEYNRRFNW